MKNELSLGSIQHANSRGRVAIEAMEPRILFHYVLINPLSDIVVPSDTPTSTFDLGGMIDSEEITGSVVRLQTSLGNIDVSLYDSAKPITVSNFLGYVTRGDYNGTLIHRSTKQTQDGVTLIQGGGYRHPTLDDISPDGTPSVPSEFTSNGVRSNVRGTIAMAKVPTAVDPLNSATSEWLINLGNNAPQLDAAAGGYVVFGEVVNSTIATADAIQQLPTYPLNGQLQEVPVRDYTPSTSAPPPGDANFVVVTDASTLDEVTYSATSSDPDLVSVDVIDDQLTLTYAGDVQEPVEITITGTGLDGSTVSDTFTVNVGALFVTVGDGRPKSVTFTDADGTVGSISVKRGTATVSLEGTGLTQSQTRGVVSIDGPVTSVRSIVLNGTDARSTLTAKAVGGDGLISVGGVFAPTGLRSLAGRSLSVQGDIELGTAARIELAGLVDATLAISGATAASLMVVGTAQNSTVSSTVALRDVRLGGFSGSGRAIQAPSIAALSVGSDFTGNLNVIGAVGSAKIAGDVQRGTWTVGNLGRIDITGDLSSSLDVGALRSLKAGSLTNADVFSASSLGRITAGDVTGSRFFAATPLGDFPGAANALVPGGSLAALAIRGVFSESLVVAASLGKLNLGTVATDAGGRTFGVAGNEVLAVVARDSAGAVSKFARLAEPTQGYQTGDFEIRVF